LARIDEAYDVRVVQLGAHAHLAPKAGDLALDAGRILAVTRPQNLDGDGLSRLLLHGPEHVAEAAGPEVALDAVLAAEQTADQSLGHVRGPQFARHVGAVVSGAIFRRDPLGFGGAALAVAVHH